MLVDISVSLLHEHSKVERFVIIAHEPATTAQHALAFALDERQRFDALLCDLSTQFSGLLEEDVDAAIESGLQALVNFLNASRSSLSQVVPDGSLVVTHTYAVPGVTPYPKGVADRPAALAGAGTAGRKARRPHESRGSPPGGRNTNAR